MKLKLIVVIKFCWYINNVFSYHNKEQWEDVCSCKNTAKQLVQDKNTFGIAAKPNNIPIICYAYS